MLLRFLIPVFIFPIFVLDTDVMAEGIRWTVSQSSHNDTVTASPHNDSLRVTITAQKTEIASHNEILFIDYGEMTLFRLNRSSAQCTVFDLKETESGSVAKKTVSLLSEFSVKESGESQELRGLRCYKKTVLSGAGMFRFRTMAPKVLTRYGQSFSEAVAEYWVSQDVENWQEIRENTQQRRAAFTAQPLLKRIDPLGLIEAVDGFPVQGWQKSDGMVLESTLVSGPETGDFTLQAPRECQGIPAKKNGMK